MVAYTLVVSKKAIFMFPSSNSKDDCFSGKKCIGATPAGNDFFLIKILQRVLLSKRTREGSGRHPL
jgi:hypothetical protein